jgi:hypothetical protein
MANDYRLVRVEADEEWDGFVAGSENGTLFSKNEYLNALALRAGRYFCYRKEELRAALLVTEDPSGECAVLHDFVIYNGILFGKPTSGQSHSQQMSEQFRVMTYVAEELLRLYRKVEISLHPSLIDARPFLWVNYGAELPKYTLDLRYTSYVEIADFAQAERLEDIAIYNRASKARRQEIRYAIRDGVRTVERFDPGGFADFYRMTFGRQGESVPESKLEEMVALLEALHTNGHCTQFVSYTGGGDPASMAIYGWDEKRAYYLFGASDPRYRDMHTGSAVLWDAFKALSSRGIGELDLEGVNSPHRGWFKLSFGGSLIPYFEFSADRGGR